MNDTPLQNVTFKITGVEKKVASNGSIFYNLKDENNRNYKLWQNIKDGSESRAYQSLKLLPNEGLNETITAGVEFQEGNYNGKPITYKTVKFISDTVEQVPTINVPAQVNSGNNDDRILAELAEIKEMIRGLSQNEGEQLPFEGDEYNVNVDEIQ